MDLKVTADKFMRGESLKDIKNPILNEVEKKFKTAQLLRKQLHHEIGKRVIQADEVLENNVFAYHPENNVVTFQSQLVESYIRENTDIFVNLIDLTLQERTSSNQTNK
ncbi:3313_t:CDS:2 [Acaulospora morrowiae]|uniref:3313_t:CDS:1 n=1 Tax=Acaulospora morrowiae TaxID=94023 RepID=A0A9N9AU42_9GLOM|nr:3313_t:CDS:2 [Acaulospora morrowiae]